MHVIEGCPTKNMTAVLFALCSACLVRHFEPPESRALWHHLIITYSKELKSNEGQKKVAQKVADRWPVGAIFTVISSRISDCPHKSIFILGSKEVLSE